MLWVALSIIAPASFAEATTAATAPPTEIRIDGVHFHYVAQGAGDPVIFIHGGLEDYRAWGTQVVAFSTRYRAIAYSRRFNFPNSGAIFGDQYSAVVDAEDLAMLIRKLGLRPAHLIGHSYGAYVALLVALRHPVLVRSLVLSEPPILRWLPAMAEGKPLFTEFMSTVWEPTTRGFRKSEAAGVEAAVNGFGELGYSGTDEKMTFATLPPEARDMLLENAPEWKALTLSKDAFPEIRPDAIRHLATPTLLLSGGRSLKLAHAIDEQLVGLLPNGGRTVLPDATHEMWNEFPEECRSAAIAFIAKH